MSISRDDEVGIRRDGDGENVVIVGIRRGSRYPVWLDHCGQSKVSIQGVHHGELQATEFLVKLRALQNSFKFREQRHTRDKFSQAIFCTCE